MADASRNFQSASAEFLLTDIDVALTFLSIANTSSQEQTVQRNRENARKAYMTVLNFLGRLALTATDRELVENKLRFLKDQLDDADRRADGR